MTALVVATLAISRSASAIAASGDAAAMDGAPALGSKARIALS